MILDDFYLMINWQVLCKIKDYVCVVGIQYVLRFTNFDDSTNPIESVGVVVRHYLVLSAPLMHPLVYGVINSDLVVTVEAHNKLVRVASGTKGY